MTSEEDANAELIAHLLEMTRQAQTAFLNGDPAPYQALFAGEAEACLLGPFGGEGAYGETDVRIGVARACTLFETGSHETDLKQAFVGDDLAVLVMIERSVARLRGVEGDRHWRLRVTQVYRRRDGAWRVVHRHADPLTGRRGVEETLALLPA